MFNKIILNYYQWGLVKVKLHKNIYNKLKKMENGFSCKICILFKVGLKV